MSKRRSGSISLNVNMHTALQVRDRREHLTAVFGLVRVADYDTGQMIQQCQNKKPTHSASVKH